MFIPEGFDEETVVSIMYQVSRQIAPRFCFGYHSIDDMVALGVQKCIETLNEGNFRPRGIKPLHTQLGNFLRVHVRNRLWNYRRDKSCRYGSKDPQTSRVKYNIMHPLKIYSQGLADNEMFARADPLLEETAQRQLHEQLLAEMTPRQRKLYRKYTNEVKLSPKEMTELLTVCKSILKPKDEDPGEET